MLEQTVNIDRVEQIITLFGNLDCNARAIEREYGVTILTHDSSITVRGEPEGVSAAVRAIHGLIALIEKGEMITDQNLHYVFSLINDGRDEGIRELTDADCVCITAKGKPVKAKTLGQRKYLQAIEQNTITVGVGPAGTGKTYLAVAMAVPTSLG